MLPMYLMIDSYVQGYVLAPMICSFGVNGVTFAGDCDSVSGMLSGYYNFGLFKAGTTLTPKVTQVVSYTVGYPNDNLLINTVTEEISFGVDPETYQIIPDNYIFMTILPNLQLIIGTFRNDIVGPGEEDILTLHPVAADSVTPVGLDESIEVALTTDAEIQFENPDSIDGSTYYYQWGKAKNGIGIIGNEIYGGGESYDGNLYIRCLSSMISTTTISVRTEPLCPDVKLSKDSLVTGDTLSIHIMGYNMHGSPVEFPENQKFNVWINTGDQYGSLLSPSTGDSGSYVTGHQPFVFLAANSIDMDTVSVNIQVQPFYGGAPLGSIGPPQIDTLRSVFQLLTKPKMKSSHSPTGT